MENRFYDYANRLTELITTVRDINLIDYWHKAHGLICLFDDGTQFFVTSSGYLYVVNLNDGFNHKTTYTDFVQRLLLE